MLQVVFSYTLMLICLTNLCQRSFHSYHMYIFLYFQTEDEENGEIPESVKAQHEVIISELKDIKAQLLPPLSMIESSRRDIWREI